jgi:hypothetical protein
MTVGIELLCLSTITKVFSYFSGACNCFSLEANGNSIWKIILKKNKQIDFCRTTCFQYTTDYITGTKSFFYKDTFVAIENFFAKMDNAAVDKMSLLQFEASSTRLLLDCQTISKIN